MRVNRVLLNILKREVLEFMCAPTNLPGTFDNFKKSLTPQELHTLELMNFKILNYFVGQKQIHKKAFMDCIPNIYRDLLLQGRKLVKLQDEKITRLGLDTEVDGLLMEIADILKGKPMTLLNIQSISSPLVSSISNFKSWLESNPTLLQILESHLYQIKCFSSRFNGDMVPPGDDSDDDMLFDSKQVSLSGSSSSSSSSPNPTLKGRPSCSDFRALLDNKSTKHLQSIFKTERICYLDRPASGKGESTSSSPVCGDV